MDVFDELNRSVDGVQKLNFSLAFVTKRREIDTLARRVANKADGDAVVWFAYPKGTSKSHTGELSRDSGSDAMRTMTRTTKPPARSGSRR